LRREEHRIVQAGSVAPQSTHEGPIPGESIQVDIPRAQREGKGLQRRRTHVQREEYTLPQFTDRQQGIYQVPPPYPFYPSQSSSSTYYHASQPFHSTGVETSGNPYQSTYIPEQSAYVPESQPFVPQQSSGMFFTTELLQPSGLTPDPPGHSRLDLNTGFDDILTFDLGAHDDVLADDDVQVDEDVQAVRRNPPCEDRGRQRPCILSPHDPHARGSHHH